MIRTAAFISVSALALACNAQSAERYEVIAGRFCSDAVISEIEDKEDYAEVEFRCNGKLYEVGVSDKFEILYVESEADIPKPVMNKISKKLEKHYSGWSIDEMDLIEMNDTSFYKIEVMKNGVEENQYFTLEGKYFRLYGASPNASDLVKILAESKFYQSAPYNFLHPDRVYDLPEVLVEISGISVVEESQVYCVQDELGVVFIFDLESGEIVESIRFTDTGDFEDIVIKNNRVFILRSDGTLFHFDLDNRNDINKVILPLECLNAEGLFFGEDGNVWLVACKEESVSGNNNERLIYRFEDEKWSKPVSTFAVDQREIKKMLRQTYDDLEWDDPEFNPSAVAVHPETSEIYVLSASGEFIAIFNNEKLTAVYPLPEEIYYKPEGIDFAANGDLLLSSEGRKKGYLNGQIFHFRKK